MCVCVVWCVHMMVMMVYVCMWLCMCVGLALWNVWMGGLSMARGEWVVVCGVFKVVYVHVWGGLCV